MVVGAHAPWSVGRSLARSGTFALLCSFTMVANAGGGGGGGMSPEARRKKKERFIERAKKLRFIKAKALKKMGGTVMKQEQLAGNSTSSSPGGRDGSRRQEGGSKQARTQQPRKERGKGSKSLPATKPPRERKGDKRNKSAEAGRDEMLARKVRRRTCARPLFLFFPSSSMSFTLTNLSYQLCLFYYAVAAPFIAQHTHTHRRTSTK